MTDFKEEQDLEMYFCDLHSHTIRSDGNSTYEELIEHAKERQVGIVAITDHDIICDDIVRDGKRITLEEFGLEHGVAVLRGIEFSCDTQIEDVHIVALGCDFTHPFFEQEYRKSIQSKIDGYRTLCERLTETGMPVSWEKDILLDGKRPEETVQRKMIFETMALLGYAPTWKDAKLMVKNTPAFQIKREKPDPIQIIKGIHEAGGIAILAHPFLITNLQADADDFRKRYIDRLFEHGLDGIEACYPYAKTSYDGWRTGEEIQRYILETYGAGHIISGGSDYHNDQKKGIVNQRDLGECGISLEDFMKNQKLASLLTNKQREVLGL